MYREMIRHYKYREPRKIVIPARDPKDGGGSVKQGAGIHARYGPRPAPGRRTLPAMESEARAGSPQ